jgi:outer membrane protein assembly factor BamB
LIEFWENRYNGTGNDSDLAQSLVLDATADVVVTGCSVGANAAYDYYTAKYAAATGELLWQNRYNSPANSDDTGTSVAVDTSGNVMVTGYSLNATSANSFYAVKYEAADGALVWENSSTWSSTSCAMTHRKFRTSP